MKCKKYDECSTPICPEDLDYNYIWYPGEDVCNRNFDFAKKHRKLAKKAKDETKYFTVSMIEHDCVVKTGITGIDPDRPEGEQLKAWFNNHPVISDEFREKSRTNLIKAS